MMVFMGFPWLWLDGLMISAAYEVVKVAGSRTGSSHPYPHNHHQLVDARHRTIPGCIESGIPREDGHPVRDNARISQSLIPAGQSWRFSGTSFQDIVSIIPFSHV